MIISHVLSFPFDGDADADGGAMADINPMEWLRDDEWFCTRAFQFFPGQISEWAS